MAVLRSRSASCHILPWAGAGTAPATCCSGTRAVACLRCPASGGARDGRDDAGIIGWSDTSFRRSSRTADVSFICAFRRTNPEASGIYAGDLGATSPNGGRRLLTTGFGAAFVAPSDAGPGGIVFARDGILYAQRLDEHGSSSLGDRCVSRTASDRIWTAPSFQSRRRHSSIEPRSRGSAHVARSRG